MEPIRTKEQALAAFAAFTPDKWNRKSVVLPPELLKQIKVPELPPGVVFELGMWYTKYSSGSTTETLAIFWRGRLVRDGDGSLWSIIRYDLFPGLWLETVNVNFYFEILHRCILNRTNTIEGLAVDQFDIGDDLSVRFDYRFPVTGENLLEAIDKAKGIQEDLEAPAKQVLDDATRALARTAENILGGHHSQISELVAQVEAASSAADKGAALESLMGALFEQVPGFVVCGRDVRTQTEEIDLVLLNDSRDPVYSRDGPLVLVECKNWTAKPGRPDFSLLESKIRNRHNRCTVAYFVSWSGFTETTGHEAIRASRESYVIVCLTGNDIRRAALRGNFPEFLRQATLDALNK